ncbi:MULTISPECIES: DnaD domain protein [Clostridium]|uniref:DnaD domain protein n=1 Tax=Clostridium paridis TaxID=2803863 RepID=A0A937K3W6_9CLOT|nr:MULTISPECIES: DnaD domain protein [Clostridium]MBL4930525.1 DnaD domain protein [Clostridium paridis]
MSTFMLKNSPVSFTPVNNIFIEKYMPKARGEFVKVYILMLKYILSGELGVSSSIIATKLNLLESDVMNALYYWQEEGLLKLIPIDKMNNFNLEFTSFAEENEETSNSISLLDALNTDSTKDMLKDIEKLIARPLSPKEMTSYLSWQKDFGFTSELILLLIEYCVSKGKRDARYIEKVALAWNDNNIKTIEDAQNYIKKSEDKWVKIKNILSYLGIKNSEIMKPQEELLDKWISKYNFSLDIIYKACNICFERLNRADFKYIDGILSKWHADNLKTLDSIAEKEAAYRSKNTKNTYQPKEKEKSKLRFDNFEGRNYDYDSLEKKLLGWDNDD